MWLEYVLFVLTKRLLLILYGTRYGLVVEDRRIDEQKGGHGFLQTVPQITQHTLHQVNICFLALFGRKKEPQIHPTASDLNECEFLWVGFGHAIKVGDGELRSDVSRIRFPETV